MAHITNDYIPQLHNCVYILPNVLEDFSVIEGGES